LLDDGAWGVSSMNGADLGLVVEGKTQFGIRFEVGNSKKMLLSDCSGIGLFAPALGITY
jgi:hypothetical protein